MRMHSFGSTRKANDKEKSVTYLKHQEILDFVGRQLVESSIIFSEPRKTVEKYDCFVFVSSFRPRAVCGTRGSATILAIALYGSRYLHSTYRSTVIVILCTLSKVLIITKWHNLLLLPFHLVIFSLFVGKYFADSA